MKSVRPPPPVYEIISQKIFFSQLMASLNVVFDVQKKWYKLPEMGEGGGRGNLGNARKKSIFFL